MNKLTASRLIAISLAFFVATLLAALLFGCGGVIEDPDPTPLPKPDKKVEEPIEYCGNGVCEVEKGEDYWSCYWDCSDPYGGPKNGYCGDGICYKESMTSCWKDCRPRQYNPEPDWPGPGPGPDPGPMWGVEPPYPDPREMLDEDRVKDVLQSQREILGLPVEPPVVFRSREYNQEAP